MSFLPSLLTDTFGAYTIGTFVSSILLGVTCFQTWSYFNKYSDPPLVKFTVGALLALEMLHVVVSIHALYHYLISNYFNPFGLLQDIWSINILFGIIGVIVLLVHLLYAMRIYHVSGRKKLIPLAISFVSLGHCALGWVLAGLLFRRTLESEILGDPLLHGIAKAILGSAAAIDMTITFTLSYYLHKNRTGIKQTDKLINRLMVITINNGVLTSTLDIATLVLVIVRSKDLLFFALSQVLATLYSNSLLGTLNSRESLKESQERDVVASSTLLSINFGTRTATGRDET
ncbi:hypothetical protein CPB84DRAFT_1389776 [Gymnopilus junonius]|uniref:DUF6534 domain-containing protein n=1 Tax=Gymnopilus junonius TaxID=109634 RepID=A0A9P5NIM5_GYMJU|nr:hypothetical protein CPB84DRAFT_1389776 [Gymnopilus junonius]